MSGIHTSTSLRPRRKRKVPDYLVKEMIDGVPFYYPGYRQAEGINPDALPPKS